MSETDAHERFLAQAIDLAVASVGVGGGPFGAVVVRGGRVLASGRNQVTSAHDPTAHAEVQAIRAACRALGTHQLSDCDLYASAEPCPMCLGAIYWSRLRSVWFAASREDAAAAGFDDAAIYEEAARPPAGRRIPFRRAHEADGRRPFDAWRANEARRPY